MNEESVVVVLLAHNEIETIETDLRNWKMLLAGNFLRWRILVGEDGSTDGTDLFLTSHAEQYNLTRVSKPDQRGYKAAFLNCLREAGDSWVIFADTGNKFVVQEILALWNLRHQDGLVVGRRSPRSDGLGRRALSFAYSRFISMLFDLPMVRDVDSGIRVYSPRSIKYLLSTDLGFSHFISSEITIRLIQGGFQYREFPIPYSGREGRSRGVPPSKILFLSLTGFTQALKLHRRKRR